MITSDLCGKKVLITGGGSGIGLAAVQLFAKCGASVSANILPGDLEAEARLDKLSRTGLNISIAPGNVALAGEAEAMVCTAIDGLGGLDYLINNAGTTNTSEPIDFSDLDAMTDTFWNSILQTNLVGVYRCSHAAAPALKACSGAIVNTASVAGLGLRGSSIAYAASKAGVINLTRSLARALAPDVRVNAVAPGFVETPLTDAWPDSRREMTLSRTMLKRLAKPNDIAESMLYLCAGASYMTAQTIVLNGGDV